MHECGDPDSPTGYGALVAYNGRGTYQFLMLGPFPNKAKAADVYDATVDRFHPPPAAGQLPKRKLRRQRPSRTAHHVARRRRVLRRCARPVTAVESGAGAGEWPS